MPFQIPVAQRRVSRATLPGATQQVSTSTGEFGGIQAKIIEEIGRQTVNVAEEFGRRADLQSAQDQKITIARQKAEAELQERKDKMNAQASILEFQDAWRTEKRNFLDKKRLDADGITKSATEKFKELQGGLLKRAATPRQKELILSGLAPEQTKMLNSISDYEAKQLSLAEVELNDARYTNAIADAGLPESNLLDILDADLTVRDALDKKGEGFDPVTANKIKSEGVSAFHEAVINGKVVSDLAFAKRYLDDNKKEILPEQRKEIDALIKEETITQTARKIANDIAFTVKDSATWQTEVNKKTKDEDIRKATGALLDAKKKDLDAQEKELTKRERETTLTNVLNAGNLESALLEANKASDPDTRILAIKTANSQYERKKRDIVTDINVFADVLDRIDKGEFKTVAELNQFYSDLSDADYRSVVNDLQSKLKADRTGKKDPDAPIKSSVAKDAFEVALGKKYIVTNSEQNAKFKFAYDRLKSAGITEFGEAVKFINNLFIEGTIPDIGILWDSTDTLTRAEAEREGKLDKWLPKISDEDTDPYLSERRGIEKIFKARNISIKDETLMRIFKKDAILGIPLSEKESELYEKFLMGNTLLEK